MLFSRFNVRKRKIEEVMKTIVKIIFIITMTLQINAQKNDIAATNVLIINKKNGLIDLDQSINLSKSIILLLEPQSGGLFKKSNHANRKIICLKNYYHDIDLGVKIGVSYELINKINFGAFYNIEVFKMSFLETRKIQGALMKLSIDYKF